MLFCYTILLRPSHAGPPELLSNPFPSLFLFRSMHGTEWEGEWHRLLLPGPVVGLWSSWRTRWRALAQCCPLLPSISGRFLMADVESKETTETAILDLETDGPTGAFQVLQKRKFGVKYDVGHRGEFLYMRTNRGSEAQNFTILCRPVAEAAAAWQPLEGFAYDAKRYVTRVLCLKDHLAVFGRQDGFTKMWVLAMGEQGMWNAPANEQFLRLISWFSDVVAF